MQNFENIIPQTLNTESFLLRAESPRTRERRDWVNGSLICDSRVIVSIGIGDGQKSCPFPSHTTRHAGPHRAVRVVEVMRVGVRQVYRSRQWA